MRSQSRKGTQTLKTQAKKHLNSDNNTAQASKAKSVNRKEEVGHTIKQYMYRTKLAFPRECLHHILYIMVTELHFNTCALVPEWLRGLTRNQLVSAAQVRVLSSAIHVLLLVMELSLWWLLSANARASVSCSDFLIKYDQLLWVLFLIACKCKWWLVLAPRPSSQPRLKLDWRPSPVILTKIRECECMKRYGMTKQLVYLSFERLLQRWTCHAPKPREIPS